jgi:DNA-binding beta-propeller fold protein YncE
MNPTRSPQGRRGAAGLPALLSLALTAGPAPAAEPPRLELVQTVPLQGAAGRMDHMALDAKGGRLFVANLSNNSLDVVDLKAGRLLRQIGGQGKAQGVAYAPDLDRVFVGCGSDGVCNAFDGKSYAQLFSVKLPDADNVRYDPGTRRVYVSHADDALSVLEGESGAVKATVKLPGPPEAFQLDTARNRIYLNVPRPPQVVAIDTTVNAVVARHPLTQAGANYPLALDADGRRVFVGCRQKPKVVILDADSGREVAAVDVPGDTDDLFYDAKRRRVYVVCGEGSIAVIERTGGDRYEAAERVPTAKLARTGLFDPEAGRLYVVLPRQPGQEAGPQLRVYQARP